MEKKSNISYISLGACLLAAFSFGFILSREIGSGEPAPQWRKVGEKAIHGAVSLPLSAGVRQEPLREDDVPAEPRKVAPKTAKELHSSFLAMAEASPENFEQFVEKIFSMEVPINRRVAALKVLYEIASPSALEYFRKALAGQSVELREFSVRYLVQKLPGDKAVTAFLCQEVWEGRLLAFPEARSRAAAAIFASANCEILNNLAEKLFYERDSEFVGACVRAIAANENRTQAEDILLRLHLVGLWESFGNNPQPE